jgi:endonuclease YncB( thermonuclease family)
MKAASALLAMFALALCLIAGGPQEPSAIPYKQPQDNNIRSIKVTSVADGDTVTAEVSMGRLGGAECVVRGVRLRLKGVSCLEIEKDASKQDVREREVAIVEREALAKLVFGTKNTTARIYRSGSYDRYDAIIYTDTLNVNEAMLAYPQGGN